MPKVRINAIVACGKNDTIGFNGGLPWKLGTDLAFFKRLTTDTVVIMGRKTWESLPVKPLPNRINIVISKNFDYEAPDAMVFRDLLMVINFIKETVTHPFYGNSFNITEEQLENYQENYQLEVFIIGGAQIYELAMPYVERLIITEVDTDIEGDTFFPIIDKDEWKEVAALPCEKNDGNDHNFVIKILDRV
jgi:dihydrofolate reductase